MDSSLPHTPLNCTAVTYICLQPSTHSGHREVRGGETGLHPQSPRHFT